MAITSYEADYNEPTVESAAYLQEVMQSYTEPGYNEWHEGEYRWLTPDDLEAAQPLRERIVEYQKTGADEVSYFDTESGERLDSEQVVSFLQVTDPANYELKEGAADACAYIADGTFMNDPLPGHGVKRSLTENARGDVERWMSPEFGGLSKDEAVAAVAGHYSNRLGLSDKARDLLDLQEAAETAEQATTENGDAIADGQNEQSRSGRNWYEEANEGNNRRSRRRQAGAARAAAAAQAAESGSEPIDAVGSQEPAVAASAEAPAIPAEEVKRSVVAALAARLRAMRLDGHVNLGAAAGIDALTRARNGALIAAAAAGAIETGDGAPDPSGTPDRAPRSKREVLIGSAAVFTAVALGVVISRVTGMDVGGAEETVASGMPDMPMQPDVTPTPGVAAFEMNTAPEPAVPPAETQPTPGPAPAAETIPADEATSAAEAVTEAEPAAAAPQPSAETVVAPLALDTTGQGVAFEVREFLANDADGMTETDRVLAPELTESLLSSDPNLIGKDPTKMHEGTTFNVTQGVLDEARANVEAAHAETAGAEVDPAAEVPPAPDGAAGQIELQQDGINSLTDVAVEVSDRYAVSVSDADSYMLGLELAEFNGIPPEKFRALADGRMISYPDQETWEGWLQYIQQERQRILDDEAA